MRGGHQQIQGHAAADEDRVSPQPVRPLPDDHPLARGTVNHAVGGKETPEVPLAAKRA